MSMWPFRQRTETRADSSYTDALVAAITANAGGQSNAFPTSTAALEACAGFVGRAFAAADVAAPGPLQGLLTPERLLMVGRALIRKGEIVLLVRVVDSQVRLFPAESYDVDGGPDPRTWTYRCTLGGPDRTHTFDRVPAESIVHIRYAVDPERPWRGYGPLQVALLAGRLSAETASALADEAGMPRGAFLPMPIAGDDPTVDALRATIRKASGQILLVEAAHRVASGGPGPQREWQLNRMGAAPPDALVELHSKASLEIYAACGLNPALFTSEGDTASREGYRQALHSVLAPLGRLVAAELSDKLEADVRLDWQELRAGDIAGRARAFQSMVGAGMDVAKAASLSGLMVSDD